MSAFQESISEVIWDIKYRHRSFDKILDVKIEDTWQRVAKAIAAVEVSKERRYWQKQFEELLTDFTFLPGGRILAGAGTARHVTLLNCFVMKIAEDSLGSIFDALKEGALTLQQGGGIGYDFSILRPRNVVTDRSGSTASGPVSFMQIWDSMSAIMQSSGSRRGAMMGMLRCDHPDIEEFIAIKSDPSKLRQFNVSVIVTDEFMQAVEKNADWSLIFPIGRDRSSSSKKIAVKVFKTLKARDLWEKIIKAAYSYAEPGVVFIDTINRMNPLWYCECITATNPCGEIPLPHYGACDLGSINLTQFVQNPFTPKATINWVKLEKTAELATRFLDNVIDVSKYPLAAQKSMSLNSRRIGLGFTGLGDALVLLGISYGSQESFQMAKKIMQTIAEVTWHQSVLLAKEKSSFPFLRKKEYVSGEFVQQLPEELRKKILRYGIRNSHHNAIAPTGTISLLANNISNGIEPIFSPRYDRKVRTLQDTILHFSVQAYSYRLWQQHGQGKKLPPAWVDAQTLTPEHHLKIQAAVQGFLDHAISKTINLPEDFPFEKLNRVYTKAYKLGLKGCTIYRPNPITGSILSASDTDQCCPVK